MTQSANERILFSWLHLSDIHFGHGDDTHRFSQRRIVGDLREDIRELSQAEHVVPSPQAILLTGDIAYKGSDDEYAQAKQWLFAVLTVLRLKRRNIFVVPGNHDVQRTLRTDRQAFRLLNDLRAGDSLDSALSDRIDRGTLSQRLTNYLAFAKEFAPACMNPSTGVEQWSFWSHRLQPQPDFNVHILGLNTAMLCNDDEDSGKLQLGPKQLGPLIDKRPGEIVFVLTHHPISDLRDAKSDYVQAISTKAELHLSGHVHNPNIERIQRSSGSHISIVAGAVHGEPGLREQGYSFGAIVQNVDKSIELRVWPRRWFAKLQRFEWDLENTNKGQQKATYPLEYSPAEPHAQLPGGSVPMVDPLVGFPQPKSTWADVVDPESARDWLSTMRLDRRDLLLPGNLASGNNHDLNDLPRSPADQWNASLIQKMYEDARRRSNDNVVSILLHGIRGVGKSLLLLRYVAEGEGTNVRLFVDCGSSPDGSTRDVRRELRAQLGSIPHSIAGDADVFVAIDGLDIACRSRAVKVREIRAEKLLEPEIADFHRIVRETIPGRRVCLMFTSDDVPEWRSAVASCESWATISFRKVIESRWGGISWRLEPSTQKGADVEVLRRILPPMSSGEPLAERPFLALPVFAEAIRNADPDELRRLSTRRHFLDQGAEKGKVMGRRQHIYYKAVEDVNNFIRALNALPAVLMPGDTRVDDCVSLIEKELTGDWMYLFELSGDEKALIGRLDQLHQSLTEDPWNHSDTYALSNVVSVLALLGCFRAEGKEYTHCNLRNAQIINAPQILRSQFHGVDFGGAKIQGATISDGKFFGVDFTGASFTNTVLKGKSVFVGCRFDRNTFDQSTLNNVKAEPDVKFVESIPEGWSPGLET